MLESEFIKNNQSKWSSLEQDISEKNIDIFEDYNQLSDDAAFSQTHYNNRSIRVYLNGLLVQLQSKMLNKRSRLDRNFWKFWTNTIPKAMYNARWVLLLSFSVFLLFTFIGYFSAASDPNYTTEVFGQSYVTQTLKNIEAGDPMAVYKKQGHFEMFVQIAANNFKVGLFAFALGCLFGIGSLFMMALNGTMVGAFMHFFYSRGLSIDFNLAVWMHGTFEISMIIIVAAAGFVMGFGLVNKKNYTTSQSFYISSKNGIHIFIATIPFIIVAAFIEGFLTRYTELPNAIRASFIIVCVLLTLYYFVIYPILKHRQGAFEKEDKEVEVLDNASAEFLKYRKFRNPMEMTLKALRTNLSFILKWSFLILTLLIVGNYIFAKHIIAEINFGAISGFQGVEEIVNMFSNLIWLPNNTATIRTSAYFFYSSPILGALLLLILSKTLAYYKAVNLKWQSGVLFLISFVVFTAILHYISGVLALILMPFLFALGAACLLEQSAESAIPNAFKYGFLRINNWLALFTVLLVTYLLAYLLHSPLFWTITKIAQLFYLKEDLAFSDLVRGILTSMAYITTLIFFILYYLNVGANYCYNKELDTFEEMSEAIDKIEVNKQILGFEVE